MNFGAKTLEIDSNVFTLAKKQIEFEIKRTVTERILKEELKHIEEELRPLIEEQVERISIAAIDNIRDMQKLRDEYKVFVEWREAKNK